MEIKIEDHTKLAHLVAHKFKYTADRLHVEYDDLYQLALIGIWKAIQINDPSKGFTFATFASRVAINEIKMHFRKITTGKYQIGNPIGDTDFMDHIPNRKSDDVFREIELRETIQQIAHKHSFKGVKKQIIDCLLNEDCQNREELSRTAGCTSSYAYTVMQELGVKLNRECRE